MYFFQDGGFFPHREHERDGFEQSLSGENKNTNPHLLCDENIRCTIQYWYGVLLQGNFLCTFWQTFYRPEICGMVLWWINSVDPHCNAMHWCIVVRDGQTRDVGFPNIICSKPSEAEQRRRQQQVCVSANCLWTDSFSSKWHTLTQNIKQNTHKGTQMQAQTQFKGKTQGQN